MLSFQDQTFITVGDKSYTVNYPNVGEILQIESLKLLYSNNTYGALVKSGHTTANDLLNLVDAMSYFSVLAPEMIKDLKIEDFSKAGPKQQKMITKAFIEYWTWYRAMNEELNKEDTKEDHEADQKDSAEIEK